MEAVDTESGRWRFGRPPGFRNLARKGELAISNVYTKDDVDHRQASLLSRSDRAQR